MDLTFQSPSGRVFGHWKEDEIHKKTIPFLFFILPVTNLVIFSINNPHIPEPLESVSVFWKQKVAPARARDPKNPRN
jgi:hypothetical protein